VDIPHFELIYRSGAHPFYTVLGVSTLFVSCCIVFPIMASTDEHPTFKTPFFESPVAGTIGEGPAPDDANDNWERASTVRPDDEAQHQPRHLDHEKAEENASKRNSEGSEPQTFDKIEIIEADCEKDLGFAFPEWKKWTILTVIFLVQLSMNFNTSLYSNGLTGISEEFGVSAQAARCGAMIFLVLYAFGCELWAPWSEELGRWPILQLSLTLVNIWQLPVALAPNFASIMVGRALGGLSSAGGSVTLGMIGKLARTPYKPNSLTVLSSRYVGCRYSTVCRRIRCVLIGIRERPWSHCRRLCGTIRPKLEMDDLDSTHLWWCCPSRALFPCTGDKVNHHHGQSRKETTQGHRRKHLGS